MYHLSAAIYRDSSRSSINGCLLTSTQQQQQQKTCHATHLCHWLSSWCRSGAFLSLFPLSYWPSVSPTTHWKLSMQIPLTTTMSSVVKLCSDIKHGCHCFIVKWRNKENYVSLQNIYTEGRLDKEVGSMGRYSNEQRLKSEGVSGKKEGYWLWLHTITVGIQTCINVRRLKFNKSSKWIQFELL